MNKHTPKQRDNHTVVGRFSDVPLVHLLCPSRAPLAPVSQVCQNEKYHLHLSAALVHLSCPSCVILIIQTKIYFERIMTYLLKLPVE